MGYHSRQYLITDLIWYRVPTRYALVYSDLVMAG
uniref:Uncharacterized protein n=1 Tax=Arundo donax TaxID=35708 RepID=A0A0A8XR96_ARUDO